MELAVEKREIFAKSTKNLRKKGVIPAELYGHGTANMHLEVKETDFERVFRHAGENTMIDLVVGGEKRPVMIHDLSRDPVTDRVVSIDFYQVRLDEKIKVQVPIHFEGEAPAVKDKGGVLVKALQELEIESLPGSIPHAVNVSLSSLTDIDSAIHVKDISVPAEVTVLEDPEAVIAIVNEQAPEEEPATAEVDVSAVKVESEEKKAERQAKREAEGGEAAKKEE